MDKQVANYYFIGIGGIGMSALARYFRNWGYSIWGYDRTPTELTRQLEQEGMHIVYDESPELIPKKLSPANTVVVRTPAVPAGHLGLNYFQDNGFKILKRSEILGQISAESFNISVAGTHGKTSVSSMIAHIFYQANLPMSAFLGGITRNYNSNFIHRGSEISISEADEFDRSFLRLAPDMGVITSTDADHLDIYHETSNLQSSFAEFGQKVSEFLLVRFGLEIHGQATYGPEQQADFRCTNIRVNDGLFLFDFQSQLATISDICLPMPGRHNVENATAAIAIALKYGIDSRVIKDALAGFKGIKRRFNVWKHGEKFFVDDYAHHPTELDAAISAARELFPNRLITGVFQPHLYSRTQDFAEGFARSLAQLDRLILLDIYPARELPIPGISSEWLFNQIELENKQLCGLAQAMDKIKSTPFDVLMTLGAGNIDTLVEPINQWLNES